jgi:TonB family protein
MPPIEIAKRASIGLCLCLGLSGSLPARKSDLAALNQQLSNEIVRANLRSVIVVDFVSEHGEPSTLGWYLADELSENWLVKKPKFRIIDRSELKDTKVTSEDLTPEMVKRLGSVWGVDAIITGVVQNAPEHYALSVSVKRVTDNTIAAAESIAIPHSRVLDLLSSEGFGLPNTTPGTAPARAGVNGVTVPICLYCPTPGYSQQARDAKYQGTVILSVIISPDGRASSVAIVKHPGLGLAEKAIEAVSEWKFKPASKDGNSVSTVVPIEVTFRLYDNR